MHSQNNAWIGPLGVDGMNYTQVLNLLHKNLPK